MSLHEEVRAHLPGHPHGHRRGTDAPEISSERLEHIRIFASLATGSMQPEEPPRGRRVADVSAGEAVVGSAPVPGKRVRRLPDPSSPGGTTAR